MAKITIKKGFMNIPKKVKEKFRAAQLSYLVGLIKELYQKGISPVRGGGRFKRYSDSYREQIKRGTGEAGLKNNQVSPVNLTLTGEMGDSLKVRDSGGRTFVEFDDPKAYFHNTSGVGKSRVIRRLLPDRQGEKFSREIEQRILDSVRAIVKSVTRK